MASAMRLLAAIGFVGLLSNPARATTEICGNDIDDDGNGLTDEGCYPALSTGVCESPLSCADTGMVSWATGSLHYDLPPDIAPTVPYGPAIGFRRFYTSMYTPGTSPASVNKTPLGPGWQHTYMTWIDRYTVSGVYHVIWHTSQGRDTDYTYVSTSGGWESYTPQNGEHVLSFKRNTSSPFQYEVQLLTGETIVYNQYGQVSEIWDTEPTPNKVLITWDSTTNGNVSTVTDASGDHRLQFSYLNGQMTSLTYNLLVSGSWTVEHTTTFEYSNGVTHDASSGWAVPVDSAEWTTLLAGTGMSNPSNLWLMQETSGDISDSIGSSSSDVEGATYNVSATGWTRKGLKTLDGHSGYTLVDPSSSGSIMLVQYYSLNTNPSSGYRALNNVGCDNWEEAQLVNGPKFQARSGSNTSTSSTIRSGSVLVVTKLDATHGVFAVYTDQGDVLKPTYSATSCVAESFLMGDDDIASDATLLYAALFHGAAAELSDAQVATLMNTMKTASGLLTSVTIGGQLAQQYAYRGSALTKITDESGNLIAAFAYSSATPGQVVLVNTPRGNVGFEYASSRATCSGDSILYFNQGNTSTCSVDSDCGSGFLCGGKTGSGSTGTCFLAGRCMTTSSVNGETVVTNIAPLGPGGGTCTGACTDVAQYVWSQGVGSNPSGLLSVAGQEDPLSGYTSILYNSNGLPVQIGYGDTDADPTNGAQRFQAITYDATFPGRIASTRRLSNISIMGCTGAPGYTAGCSFTNYTYDSNNQVSQVQQTGTTLTSSGSNAAYAYDTVYSHDAQGRITEIDVKDDGTGTVYNKTKFDYYSSADATKNGYLQDYKIYSDATHYLEPQVTTYDFWGHPTSVEGPDGNFTCDTYDTARGTLASRRKAMVGQTSCTTPNGADLTTSWARDSALRLSQLTRPDGTCVFYSYDSTGRLYQVKRRDDCNASSAGDTRQWNYTPDSLVSEVDTYNSSNTLTAKQPYAYFDSRRLAEIVNPVDTSKFTGLVYDSAGQVNEVDGASSLSKTTYTINADHRVTAENRYIGASTYNTWSLLYSWEGDQSQVEDGESKITGSIRDDANRVVKISSPDTAGPTIRLYDAAGRTISVVEDLGNSGQQSHSFTFDQLNRPLDDDYYGACISGGHPEIIRTYDALPSGVTCPMTGGCNNLEGRLALVEVTLMCSSSYADGALDRYTYYSYDAAGRVIEEYVTDDSGLVANQLYTYNKNGALSQITMPSGVVIGANFGTSGNNSDGDLVTGIWRTSSSTPVIDTVLWAPFGPWMQYNWEASIGGSALRNRVSRNLAYRVAEVFGAEYQSGAGYNDSVTITEDAKGRTTSRVFDPAISGVNDSHFLYDEQDRVTCETTDYQSSCPTSYTGNDIKNNHNQSPPFLAGGDWIHLLRRVPGSANGYINSFDVDGTKYNGTHQVQGVSQTDGTPAFGETAFDYDERGNRTVDDNPDTLSHDSRDYTYDARRNVINVRGQYYKSSAWHYYDVASAFDAKNRRVFKSFYDETTAKTAQWFFFYDSTDRLTEVSYTYDTSSPSNYSVFQLFWLGHKLVAYWQTDYPGVVTSKRYVTSDEADRPLKLWNWPSSGDATIYWMIDPRAWGVDIDASPVAGIYQPVLFAGQYQDVETAAYEDNGTTRHRPGLALNGARTYDPFVGGYLQMDPLAEQTWSTYIYANSNPVGGSDPSGALDVVPGSGNVGQLGTCQTPTGDECDPGGNGGGDGIGGWIAGGLAAIGAGSIYLYCEITKSCDSGDPGSSNPSAPGPTSALPSAPASSAGVSKGCWGAAIAGFATTAVAVVGTYYKYANKPDVAGAATLGIIGGAIVGGATGALCNHISGAPPDCPAHEIRCPSRTGAGTVCTVPVYKTGIIATVTMSPGDGCPSIQ